MQDCAAAAAGIVQMDCRLPGRFIGVLGGYQLECDIMNKNILIIIIVSLILVGGVVLGFVFLSGDDGTEPTENTPATTEEESTETDSEDGDDSETEGTEEDGEDMDDTGNGEGEETGEVDPLVNQAREAVANLTASNDRYEALLAACDLAGMEAEAQTFREHTQAAVALVEANQDADPAVLEELADIPDQINTQTNRSLELATQAAACQ